MWIIEGETSADRIEGSMHTPGQTSDHSSFCSEAAGIYGALLTIWFFVEEYITKGTITIACDGRSVLDRLNSKKTIDPFAAHSDLLRACKSIQAQMPCTTKLIHVKGHQDNGSPTVLSREAWLNIEADLMAKSRIASGNPSHPNSLLPFEPWRLLINNTKVVKQHHRAIRSTMNGPAAQQYWRGKNRREQSNATGNGHTGNGESAERKHTREEVMGDKTHHRSLCTQKKYGTKRPKINHHLSEMPSRIGGQTAYNPVPSRKCKRTMEAKHPETQPVDEGSRHGPRNLFRDTKSTHAMDT